MLQRQETKTAKLTRWINVSLSRVSTSLCCERRLVCFSVLVFNWQCVLLSFAAGVDCVWNNSALVWVARWRRSEYRLRVSLLLCPGCLRGFQRTLGLLEPRARLPDSLSLWHSGRCCQLSRYAWTDYNAPEHSSLSMFPCLSPHSLPSCSGILQAALPLRSNHT